jgi:hypothetical protein
MSEHGSWAAAFVAVQAELPAVGKDSENPHFHSRFVSHDALVAATRPVLNKHGMGMSQAPVRDEHGEPALRTTLLHGPTGEERVYDTPLFLGRLDMQGFGAAITYARRYAWSAVLGIASEEDTDGNEPGATPPSRSEPKPSSAERPPMAARPPRSSTRMVTKPQMAKMHAIVKDLNANATPIPADYAGAEDWVAVLKMRLQGEYGIESRAELKAAQASELIDWLDAQAIPF